MEEQNPKVIGSIRAGNFPTTMRTMKHRSKEMNKPKAEETLRKMYWEQL